LVIAKLDKKIKDLKLQLKDSISNSSKEMTKTMKANNKALKDQITL